MSRSGIIAGLSLKSAGQRTRGFLAGIDWSRRLRMEAGPVSGSNARRRGSGISGDGRRRMAERSPTGEGAMHACIFTPEDAEGFSAQELAEMNAAYARLG